MTPDCPPSRRRGTASATRRGFLAAIGAVGAVGLVGAGRPAGTTAASTVHQDGTATHASPFGDPDALEAFVDDRVRERLGSVTPGASVAVVRGDRPVLVKGYGSADVDTDAPVHADRTAFRVGSVGKLVTWTAVVQGVERGVLDLDADVTTYLTDSAVTVPGGYDDPVTLRHLGTHTAGFESTLDPDLATSRDAIAPLETVLARAEPTRVRPPGELVGYSNYGAALAGHVVAEVNGTTFEEYVQEAIFEPLGMPHSTFTPPGPGDQHGTLGRGHTRTGGEFEPTDEVFINMRPAGSMRATASDMATFMRAHLGAGAVDGTQILASATAEAMHATQHVRHPAVTNWRYGFHEYGHPDGDLIGHSGATLDFTSHLVLSPDHDIGIFVNYNANGDERPAALVDEIVAEFDLQPPGETPIPTTEPGHRGRAETVAGEYSPSYLPDRGALHVADVLAHLTVEPANGGRLRTRTLGGDVRRWVETEPYVYEAVDGHDVLAFEVSDGEVAALNVNSEPTGVFEPVPAHRRRSVVGAIAGAPLAGFALSLTGRGASAARRYWHRRRDAADDGTEGAE
ncbi:serine hydrolase domain-containing protein [Haloglomus litoreum]|uniref:serine hydrolase domain-containing protein n=1 Tax=Haloglomus litoreum TaxID=3034026 RepID=UPI0023E8E21F|nr:serine hydrolase domain-containing protein [Haloglomus sp. DT116]